MNVRKALLLLTASLSFVAVAPSGASAALLVRPSTTPKWCYTYVLTQAQMAAGETNVIRCYNTEADMDTARLGQITTLSFSYQRLAIHWDTLNATGDSLSIYGVDCGGGGLSLSGTSWDNRIGSTQHGACYSIYHYPAGNFTGSAQLTQAGCGQVRSMDWLHDNDTSSILYYGPESGSCNL